FLRREVQIDSLTFPAAVAILLYRHMIICRLAPFCRSREGMEAKCIFQEGCLMFRDLRRSRQALSPEECGEILCHGTSGVLALAGDDGYPYAVPLSYVYAGGKLYFHCAK